jgi:H+/Cl- antiporter ClcA
MELQNWRRVFAYAGLAVIGLALAYYATAVATGGVAAGNLGQQDAGRDLFSAGSAALLVGVATMAVFGFLALRLVWVLTRGRPR